MIGVLIGGRAHRLLIGLVATLLAVGLVAAPPAARDVRAASSDLTVTADARYEVVPERARVRVTVDLVATNHLRDTNTRRYYFDRGFLAVPPGTTGFKLTSPTGKPSVRVSQRKSTHLVLALGFGQRINSGKSARFRLTFDLPDPGGSAIRAVRVGTALVSFPVWGFGYPTGGAPGSVTVTFPKGYAIQVEAGRFPEPTTDAAGRAVYATGRLSDASKFFAYLVADRASAYAETTVAPKVGDATAQLTIRAWPDDPAWAKRVGGLLGRGLPVLGDFVGLPWTPTGPLVVQEAVSRTTGGYAGLFAPAEGRIEIAYYAGDLVVLHEAAHAWFNGALLADRWANEAFASYYGVEAAQKLKVKVQAPTLTEALKKAKFALNAWPAAAAANADTAAEDYGYAASLALAREIAKRAGEDGLRRVWQAAAAGTGAYQPPTVGAGPARSPETGAPPPDWRSLLDLLEENTSGTYDDLWRTWVVRDGETPLLDARHDARAQYAAVLHAAGRWELPPAIRQSLRAWQFDQAKALMTEAQTVLDRRVELERAAAAAGLTLPTRLQTAFEGNGFSAAIVEADAEGATIGALVGAATTRPAQPDALQSVGLIGQTPDATLAAARQAFGQGELVAAADGATQAQAAWTGASALGTKRLLTALGFAILAILALVVLASAARTRRRRRVRRDEPAGPAADVADAQGVD